MTIRVALWILSVEGLLGVAYEFGIDKKPLAVPFAVAELALRGNRIRAPSTVCTLPDKAPQVKEKHFSTFQIRATQIGPPFC